MKKLPRTIISTDDALARGLDFAFVTLGFFGIGYVVDRWLGTTPLFMIVLVVVALIGQFARIWYAYDASMRRHEAERAADSRATRVNGAGGATRGAGAPAIADDRLEVSAAGEGVVA